MKILSVLKKIINSPSRNQEAVHSTESKKSIPSPHYIIQNDITKNSFRASEIAFRFPVEVNCQIKRWVKFSFLDDTEKVKKALNYDAIKKLQKEGNKPTAEDFMNLVGSFSIMKVNSLGLPVKLAELKTLITTDLDSDSCVVTGLFEYQIFNISSEEGYSWARTLKYSEDYAESMRQKFF